MLFNKFTRVFPYFSLYRRISYTEIKQAAGNRLFGVVSDEMKYEQKKYRPLANLKLLDNSGFKFVDTPNTVEMRLEKIIDENTSVEIRYQANEPLKLENEQENSKENKDEDIMPDNSFSILIRFKDNSGLVLECVCAEKQLGIMRVVYHKDVKEMIDVSDIKKAVDMGKQYSGPEFRTLDEKLQNAVFELVSTLGITEKVLDFVMKSAKDKEVRLYYNWLTQIQEFAKKFTGI